MRRGSLSRSTPSFRLRGRGFLSRCLIRATLCAFCWRGLGSSQSTRTANAEPLPEGLTGRPSDEGTPSPGAASTIRGLVLTVSQGPSRGGGDSTASHRQILSPLFRLPPARTGYLMGSRSGDNALTPQGELSPAEDLGGRAAGGPLPNTPILGEKHPETVWPLVSLSGLDWGGGPGVVQGSRASLLSGPIVGQRGEDRGQ